MAILDLSASGTASKRSYYHFPNISLLIFLHPSPSELSPPLYTFTMGVLQFLLYLKSSHDVLKIFIIFKKELFVLFCCIVLWGLCVRVCVVKNTV